MATNSIGLCSPGGFHKRQQGNQVDAIGNYVKSSNNHFGRNVQAKSVYTDVDVYNKDADGNWVKTKSEKRTFVTLQ